MILSPPQEISDYVSALVQDANNYLPERTVLHRPYEKMLSRLSQAGELEFFNPGNKIELAIGYGEYVVKPFEAKYWLKRAEEHANFLDKQIGDKRTILAEREFDDIALSFREESPGFEDPHDVEVDIWRQIYSNQQERITR